jgi:hypothetical protein
MDPIKSNLEPIEESDLDLENKIKKGTVEQPLQYEAGPSADIESKEGQEISAGEKESAYSKILSKIKTQSDDNVDQAEIVEDARKGIEKTDAETQIQHLVDIAQQKGIFHAVKVARHMEDNYILDTFHDRLLADELHNALVQKGMIKEM